MKRISEKNFIIEMSVSLSSELHKKSKQISGMAIHRNQVLSVGILSPRISPVFLIGGLRHQLNLTFPQTR